MQSLSRLGDMELQKCNISKLGMPSLERNMKYELFQTCGSQVLTNIFTCVHVLEDQVMKDIIQFLLRSMIKLFPAKSFKTWKAKS